MIFSQFQREDQDAVYTIAYNASTGAMVAGGACVWDSGASANGLRVTTAAANTLKLLRGICVEAIANSAYGRVLLHGYYSGARVKRNVTTVAPGDVLQLVAGADNLEWLASGGAGHLLDSLVYAADTVAAVTQTTLSTVTTGEVFVRAL